MYTYITEGIYEAGGQTPPAFYETLDVSVINMELANIQLRFIRNNYANFNNK